MQRKYGPFENGYSASVIDNGYGSEQGLFELAILGPSGSIAYRRWLTQDDVNELLERIKALPNPDAPPQSTTGKVETPIERATRHMPSEVNPVELFGDMFRTE